MRGLTEAGARVYALSYDEPDALKDFRDAHGLTFTLLSDPDSNTIRQFEILNTLIAEDDHPWFGIPYPGTYVLGADGVITHKFFENNLAVRAGPEQLLRAVLGETIDTRPRMPGNGCDVIAQVFLEGDVLAVSVQRDLVARVTVPAGRHIYASPAPHGAVALNLELDPNPKLVLRDVVRPTGTPHTLGSTGETFKVHHNAIELRLPITINGALTVEGAARELTVSGTLRWQTCDDEVCDIPVSQRFELRLPVIGPVLPEIRNRSDDATREPNAAQHFQRMIDRRTP